MHGLGAYVESGTRGKDVCLQEAQREGQSQKVNIGSEGNLGSGTSLGAVPPGDTGLPGPFHMADSLQIQSRVPCQGVPATTLGCLP